MNPIIQRTARFTLLAAALTLLPQAAWYIPTFLVPALLVSHFLVFKLLLGPRR